MASNLHVTLKRRNDTDEDTLLPKTTWSQVLNKPLTFTATSHSHSASEITSGVLADSRIPSLAISKITGLQTALDGKAVSTHTHSIANVTGLQDALNAKLSTSLKGAVNGLAELGADGKVPSSQLPSYVDDVLEYANLAGFPVTGETGKIYIAIDTNKTYRWGGSAYTVISETLALGATSSTAYRGDRGKIAYDHSQVAHAPSNAQKNSNITKAEIEAKLTGEIASHTHAYEPTFTKNTGFNKDFGTTVGTVAQGNDSRFSNARTPLAHTHTKSQITDFPTSMPPTAHSTNLLTSGTLGIARGGTGRTDGYAVGVVETRSSVLTKIWTGTEVQYNAIGTKDANTLYFII